jgi:hypothetical protein
VRYRERPELWDAISGLSSEVWPEYNQHGQTLNRYWAQLYDVWEPNIWVIHSSAGEPASGRGRRDP